MYESLAYFYDNLGWDHRAPLRCKTVLEVAREEGLEMRALLDLACGTGTFALLMAERGISVTGVDFSREMIEVARTKAASRDPLAVVFEQQDMRALKLASVFDLVTCNGDSINHILTENELQAVFASVLFYLRRGGAFLFDLSTQRQIRQWRYQKLWQNDEFVVLRHGTYDEETSIGTTFIDAFVQDPAPQNPASRPGLYLRLQETIRERAFPVHRVRAHLDSAGFRSVSTVGPARGKDDEDLEHLHSVLFLARK